MKQKTTDELAKILWNFNCLNSPLHKVDFIIAMGSHDLRIAERACTTCTGWIRSATGMYRRIWALTAHEWTSPEAEMFADIARKWECPIIK